MSNALMTWPLLYSAFASWNTREEESPPPPSTSCALLMWRLSWDFLEKKRIGQRRRLSFRTLLYIGAAIGLPNFFPNTLRGNCQLVFPECAIGSSEPPIDGSKTSSLSLGEI